MREREGEGEGERERGRKAFVSTFVFVKVRLHCTFRIVSCGFIHQKSSCSHSTGPLFFFLYSSSSSSFPPFALSIVASFPVSLCLSVSVNGGTFSSLEPERITTATGAMIERMS